MDLQKLLDGYLGRLNPRVATRLFGVAQRIPFVRARVEHEFDQMLDGLDDSLKPYRTSHQSYDQLPPSGRDRDVILAEMDELWSQEQAKWKDGFVSGAVYHGDDGHIEFLNRVYAQNSQSNPLHADLWPSTTKYESEIVAMTAHMLGGGASLQGSPDERVCGAVSSGGTESILLAMKAYRDRARRERGIRRPQMVVPTSAHAAFHKASQYFGIEMIQVPVGDDFRADVPAMKRAITDRTIVLVGSAPSFPHGVIDPIAELSDLARRRRIGFHTDACLGGFVLPWARKLGYPVPPFDFELPGVTSMSADTHKYGYAAKGTSVVLYRGLPLRRYQYYTTTEWPGGLYFSPTFAGSRPGALSAACWAAMLSLGEEGYLDAAKRILETAERIKEGVRQIGALQILGDPLWVIAFRSAEVDIYRVMDVMTGRGWSLNGLHKPSCVHLCVTLRHTQQGVAERFLSDLRAAVEEVRRQPSSSEGMAPVYGLAASLPVRSVVGELLERYMDKLYEV
ncbi:MAG: aminotransferase class V-fold PLP-dependent enzyme [Deltaproteobacteria bacterium]|jgi:glutamate/tyrosine decarboxylase-like PLP-dependent enzyme|nr:aminotransferase class V-fold PLP-dependent enzyme [Deltaproteobacteria bacterium]MBW2533665.1 aminotransferase class V-fold PLP-dependent enzyme [Deltaproteobacteria bacterium]